MSYTQENSVLPRSYQVELVCKANEKNTIVFLNTGTGKTYIAIMLIKEKSEELRPDWNDGAKRTFFIVNSVPLVHQQGNYVRKHTNLCVGQFTGSLSVDLWRQDKWETQFKRFQVLVMTAQIFLNILNHGFIKLDRVNLVVFDECHHAIKNHPYKKIMEIVMDKNICKPVHRPHILGLTASVINKKCHHSKISENLKKLELVLNSSMGTSLNYSDIAKYSTKPKELIYVFQLKAHPCHAWIDFNIIKPLNAVVKTLTLFAVKDQKGKDLGLTDKDTLKNKFDLHVTLLRQLHNMALLYGPWCGLMAARIFNHDLIEISKRAEDAITKNAYSLIISTVQNIIVKMSPIITPNFGIKELLLLSTTKLQTLVKILEIYSGYSAYTDVNKHPNTENSNERHQNTKSQFTAIIFVEARFTAIIVNLYLNTIAKFSEKLSFIKSGYIIGHGLQSKKICRAAYMLHRSQEDVLNRFRSGELNVLIGTKVVEEGIDVPKCNLVIRFDLPQNFRSYVQSKGRARAENSHYVVMVANTCKKALFSDLRDYARIEKTLTEKCVDREGPDPEDSAAYHKLDELMPPYQPVKGEGEPRVTLTSAISLINWYCSRLPTHTLTTLQPKIKTRSVEIKPSEYANVPGIPKFQTAIKLPISSVIRRAIIGPPMDCVKAAQMAAALKCCEVLHIAGELNDNLLPHSIKTYAIGYADSCGVVKEKSRTPNRKLHFKKIAQCLKTALPIANHPCILYELNINFSTSTPGLHEHQTNLYQSGNFGILSRNTIPKIPQFSMCTTAGDALVTLTLRRDNVFIEESHLVKLNQFHQYIFKNVACATFHDIFSNTANNILITVLDQGKIDDNFIENTLAKENKPVDSKNLDCAKFKFHQADQGIGLSTSAQTKALQQGINQKQILTPHLCRLHPFDTLLWRKTVCLPSILHRLNYFLICNELRTIFARDIDLGPTGPTENNPLNGVDPYDVNYDDDVDTDGTNKGKFPIVDFPWKQVCDEHLENMEGVDCDQQPIDVLPTSKPSKQKSPSEIYNMGNDTPDSELYKDGKTKIVIVHQDKTFKIIHGSTSKKSNLPAHLSDDTSVYSIDKNSEGGCIMPTGIDRPIINKQLKLADHDVHENDYSSIIKSTSNSPSQSNSKDSDPGSTRNDFGSKIKSKVTKIIKLGPNNTFEIFYEDASVSENIYRPGHDNIGNNSYNNSNNNKNDDIRNDCNNNNKKYGNTHININGRHDININGPPDHDIPVIANRTSFPTRGIEMTQKLFKICKPVRSGKASKKLNNIGLATWETVVAESSQGHVQRRHERDLWFDEYKTCEETFYNATIRQSFKSKNNNKNCGHIVKTEKLLHLMHKRKRDDHSYNNNNNNGGNGNCNINKRFRTSTPIGSRGHTSHSYRKNLRVINKVKKH